MSRSQVENAQVPCEIIVEIGNSHEGSIGIAKSFIDMAAQAGAKTVKFQMHIAEFEGVPDEPFRIKFSDQDQSRSDYWRRINFSLDGWRVLHEYCNEKGVEFLCTPFSVEAARTLYENRLVKRWKIGSGQAVDWPLIDYVSDTGLPLIISTGLISNAEILLLRERLTRLGSWKQTTLLHCVSKYPVKETEIDFHLMDDLRILGCKVGYSSHSSNWLIPLYAIAQGAEVVEVHMTPHRKFFGPDVTSSISPDEIEKLCEYAHLSFNLRRSNRTKSDHYKDVEHLRGIFRKGIYWSRSVPKNSIVRLSDLTFLKPVRGIDVIDYERLLGMKLLIDVEEGHPVNWNELQELGE